MKTVDVRNLQHHFGRFLDEVEAGEVIEVRRRRRIIARITPYTEYEHGEPWPDVRERLESYFPTGPVAKPASEQIYEDRGKR